VLGFEGAVGTMNKPGNAGAQGGGVGNFGPGGVAGPTAAAAAQAAQRQRSLLQRADADIGSLLDNFSHLLKAARVSASPVSSNCFPRQHVCVESRFLLCVLIKAS
jgi:hypothetical protein